MTTKDDEKPNKSGRTQDGRFAPGVSGNPSGPPKGYRHKVTKMLEKLMQDDAEEVVKAVIRSARNGDVSAARMIVDRMAPARKDATIEFALPPIRTPADAVAATGSILEAVSNAELTPGEGETLVSMVATVTRVLETEELERRLTALEQHLGAMK